MIITIITNETRSRFPFELKLPYLMSKLIDYFVGVISVLFNFSLFYFYKFIHILQQRTKNVNLPNDDFSLFDGERRKASQGGRGAAKCRIGGSAIPDTFLQFIFTYCTLQTPDLNNVRLDATCSHL